MSIVKIKEALKGKYQNNTKVLFANISTETADDNNNTNMYIKLNGMFKLIQISYQGKIKRLSSSNKFVYHHSKKTKKIIIRNPRKIDVQDSVDIQYIGTINKFTKVKIFNWGGGYIAPVIETPSYIQNKIGLNKNTFGTSTEKFKGAY